MLNKQKRNARAIYFDKKYSVNSTCYINLMLLIRFMMLISSNPVDREGIVLLPVDKFNFVFVVLPMKTINHKLFLNVSLNLENVLLNPHSSILSEYFHLQSWYLI